MTGLGELLSYMEKVHQNNPPYPGAVFDEQKHRWVVEEKGGKNYDTNLVSKVPKPEETIKIPKTVKPSEEMVEMPRFLYYKPIRPTMLSNLSTIYGIAQANDKEDEKRGFQAIPVEWVKKFPEMEMKYPRRQFFNLTKKPVDGSIKIDASKLDSENFRMLDDNSFLYVDEYGMEKKAAVYDDPKEERLYLHHPGGGYSKPEYHLHVRIDERGEPYYLRSDYEKSSLDGMLNKIGSRKLSVQERAKMNRDRLLTFADPDGIRRWEETAKKFNMSVEELKKITIKKVQPLVDEGRIYIRMPSSKISSILSEGRFKNISEKTQMSPGKAEGVKLYDYQNQRKEAENELFGYKEIENKDRPVYGFLASDDDNTWLSDYGDCKVKIKNSVRDRCTFTGHDSLDVNQAWILKYHGARAIPSPIDNIAAESFLGDWVNPKRRYKYIEEIGGDYNEVQIHNGLNVEDIEEVFFKKEPSGATKKSLANARIPYKILKSMGEEAD